MAIIFILEDDTEIGCLYKRIFSGEQTCIFNDLPQALVYLRFGRPDLAIIDLHLPSGSGIEAIHMLRSQSGSQGIPILVVTVDDALKDEAMAEGASAFMPKPFGVSELMAEVYRLLEQSGRGAERSDVEQLDVPQDQDLPTVAAPDIDPPTGRPIEPPAFAFDSFPVNLWAEAFDPELAHEIATPTPESGSGPVEALEARSDSASDDLETTQTFRVPMAELESEPGAPARYPDENPPAWYEVEPELAEDDTRPVTAVPVAEVLYTSAEPARPPAAFNPFWYDGQYEDPEIEESLARVRKAPFVWGALANEDTPPEGVLDALEALPQAQPAARGKAASGRAESFSDSRGVKGMLRKLIDKVHRI
jgi:CheY-like chemotaxis protein